MYLTMCVVMAFAIDSALHGYHIYKDIWSAEIDSELPRSPESGNHKDRYAIKHACSNTLKSGTVYFCCGN